MAIMRDVIPLAGFGRKIAKPPRAALVFYGM
jgi:hypothetical protein